jgi:hypothetical protein
MRLISATTFTEGVVRLSYEPQARDARGAGTPSTPIQNGHCMARNRRGAFSKNKEG